ncbi:protein translocase subunit SecF [Candidatus Peregrinibacteria bacterium]|nr:protein translocase subunit SecF [Candidatus Peregrinibacteria bacterium]
MRNNRLLQSGLIILVAVLLGFYNLPGELQKQLLPFLPKEIYEQKVNLGLDLQGGSQLDYKVDLRNVPEKDRSAIVEGIITVIQKRVNGLGVAEPNIYPSQVGEETHIIVELAGIKDLDQAKETVGKTIQLEFKERRDTPDPAYAEEIKTKAEAALATAKTTEDFNVFGEGEQQSNPGKVYYNEVNDWQYKEALPNSLADTLFTLEKGQVSDKLLESDGEYALDATGSVVQMNGYNIVKLIDKQTVDKAINEPRKVKTAHILIAFKGASGADTKVTRSEEEAKQLADEIVNKLKENKPENTFDSLAKQYSDDSSNKDQGGVIDTYIAADDKQFASEYVKAANEITRIGDVSAPIKSPFGYHLIKLLEIKEPVNTTEKADQIKYARLFYNNVDDQWQATELNGKYFQRAEVQFDQLYQPHVAISFNSEGAKLFEDLTGKNINKPLAIFVGGNLISAPNVNQKIVGGTAVITGQFTIKEAEELARDLNTGAIPAPILLVGQYNIGASLGQNALDSSLWAGLIGFGIIALFMIFYYRLAGFIATIALAIYTAILIFLIKCSLPLPLSLGISVAIFGYIVYRVLNSKESGPEKLIALVLSCFILFFVSFLLSTSIVMTLAGVAGVILSIGMAVDANILIFERIKEELRDGRPVDSAVTVGFDRAWNSIKDSNFSSLITCAILFYFGSSIIQGFAFNLAAGILVSMFSAISVTRVLLSVTMNSKLGNIKGFFGRPKRKSDKLLPVIQNRAILYGISVVTVVLSIIALFTFGLKPSLDFTGGSLMELKFANQISSEDLNKSIHEIEEEINKARNLTPFTETTSANTTPTANSTDPKQPVVSSETSKLDLGTIHIVSTGETFIIKSRDISAEDHDLILKDLRAKHGDLEEKRFQSVGPTIGESLRNRAFIAIVFASIAIILYIAFAFRKVPASVGKWKFGVSAIIALLHDTVVLIGIYVVLGLTMGLEIDALFITAILTVMGFSVHDTIVVLDRLREKLRSPAKDKTFSELTNEAVNETLARSINTSLTAALALLALVLFGPESIKGFNLALLIGLIVGTYSSIFIASPILVDWYNKAHSKKS